MVLAFIPIFNAGNGPCVIHNINPSLFSLLCLAGLVCFKEILKCSRATTTTTAFVYCGFQVSRVSGFTTLAERSLHFNEFLLSQDPFDL